MLGNDLSLMVALSTVNHVYTFPNSGKKIKGVRWIWNTYEEWQRDWFPFWSKRTIQTVFIKLKKAGMIDICQPDGHLSRKNYYRVTEAAKQLLTEGRYNDMKPAFPLDDAEFATSNDAGFAVSDGEEFSASITERSSENTSDISRKTAPDDAEKEAIFQAYPSKRRGGRKEAYRAIKAALKDMDAATLLARVKAYATSPDVKKKERDGELNFVPLLASWLNKGRYEEEILPPVGTHVRSYVPPSQPEPPRWREIMTAEFPASPYANNTTPWNRIPSAGRDMIVQAMKSREQP